MSEFSIIPIFIAVVECGGFSPAAHKLGISKSAVSKRITQLESRLGVRLLYRTTRRLSLTEAGERYFEHAVKALAHACEAEDAVTQLQSTPQGRLRINVPMSFGRMHLAPLIPRFLVQYPKIQIDMTMEDGIVNLVDEGYDLAIRAGELPDSSLVARELVPLRTVLCASPSYLERYPQPAKPGDLHQHNCVIFSHGPSEWLFERNGITETVAVSGNLRVSNGEVVREGILQGLGIGRVASFLVGADLASGRLRPVLAEYHMPTTAFNIVYPQRRHLPSKVRVFIDFMTRAIDHDEPYWDNW